MAKKTKNRCANIFYRVIVETVEGLVIHFAVRNGCIDAFVDSIEDTFPCSLNRITSSFENDSVERFRNWYVLI